MRTIYLATEPLPFRTRVDRWRASGVGVSGCVWHPAIGRFSGTLELFNRLKVRICDTMDRPREWSTLDGVVQIPVV